MDAPADPADDPSRISSASSAPASSDQTLYLRARAREADGSAPLAPLLFADEVDAARGYADASRAAATRRAYASDWRRFTAWCDARGAASRPAAPELVAVFLSAEARAGARPATVARRLAAIGYHHQRARLPSPTQVPGSVAITEVLAGIRREHGAAPKRKRAADGDTLMLMLRAVDMEEKQGMQPLRAVRDRAVLALGMAGALRRSELVALQVGDVLFDKQGLELRIARSKTDQEGEGQTIAIPAGRRIRPVQLLRDWLDAAGHREGPLFRRLTRGGTLTAEPMHDGAVARLVKRYATLAGIDGDFSAHSLRAGFLTEAARQGATIFKMREVSRHKSVQVLADYVRDAELFRDHAGERFL